MPFSERYGFVQPKNIIQKDDMDEHLRTGLWNAFQISIRQQYRDHSHMLLVGENPLDTSNLKNLFIEYWASFFKWGLDELPRDIDKACKLIKQHFLNATVYDVYDFVEFTAKHCPKHIREDFVNGCNEVLKREMSAYRFVDLQITEITSEVEIESIETAIDKTSTYSGAQEHLKTALKLLSDRKKPEYRNSMKESISAVEALCKSLTGKGKATLGELLKEMERSYGIHGALKDVFSKLYGYTSDADGIRHAMLDGDEHNVHQSDACFMLVACSAFINYVISKHSERT